MHSRETREVAEIADWAIRPLGPLSLPPMRILAGKRDELLALRNIGPAMRRDFELLGIRTVRQLARRRAEQLYVRLQQLTGQRQDPCVLDTFAAAIHQARTGEALPWWHFSRARKRAEGAGRMQRAARRS